jgi:hypothetical protein
MLDAALSGELMPASLSARNVEFRDLETHPEDRQMSTRDIGQ